MKPSEIAKTFKMDAEKRHDLFIEMAARTRQVYGLSDNEGWALLGDDTDVNILPLFPDPKLAEVFRKSAGFEGYQVEKLDLIELLEWLATMEQENMIVATLPNQDLEGVVVEPADLKEDILAELESQQEGAPKP